MNGSSKRTMQRGSGHLAQDDVEYFLSESDQKSRKNLQSDL